MKSLVRHLESSLGNVDAQWWFPAEKKLTTLSDLWRRAGAIAIDLRQYYKIGQHDSVAIILENSSDYISTLLAIWRLGAVAIPIRPYGGKHFWFENYLAEALTLTKFRAVLCEADNELLDTALLSARLGRPFIKVESLGNSNVYPLEGSPDCGPSDHAIIQFTSGSTGSPKGVIVTHGMMMAQLEQLHENHVFARRGVGVERALSWLPFYHDMGMFIGVLLPLYEHAHGGAAPPSYYMRNPGRWFHHLAAWKADLSFTTNSVLASSIQQLHRLAPEKCDLSALHLYVAAEKVNAGVLRDARGALENLGMPPNQIHIGYGMAEYALGCTHSPRGYPKSLPILLNKDGSITISEHDHTDVIELVSVGIPNSRCTVTIRDAAGNVMPPNHVGEINLEGPCVSPGYIGNPGATAEKMPNSRLRTGDLGFLHDEELYFLSRKDDLLVVGGRNIVPGDVELLVEELEFVGHGRSVLFGVENPHTSATSPVLLIESSAHVSGQVLALREEKIRELVANEVGLFINQLAFVEKGTIEKTSSGKKRTNVIRERYLRHEIERIQVNESSIAIS